MREIAEREPVPALDVWLNIDVRVQALAEAALGDEAGAVVALDPVDGRVVALASYPRFDPNAFIRGLSDEEFDLYFEDPLQPFVNRASEALYPPGSTFKIVTLAAAIEGGGFDPSDQISCPAEWDGLGEDAIKTNWKEEDRGLITLTQAIAESCNTVFYELAVRLHNQDEDLLPAFAEGFGFGRLTGIVGVGDVVGQVKPTSGGGIYFGLLSADIAAAVIGDAVRAGDVSAANLMPYERQWRALLESEIRQGYALRKLVERLPDSVIEHMHRLLNVPVLRRVLVAAAPSFDWHSGPLTRVLVRLQRQTDAIRATAP